MNATYKQMPGTLDIQCVAGDFFSMLLTFSSMNLTTYTFDAEVINKNTREKVLDFTVVTTGAASGAISIQLTAAQTLGLVLGSYDWYFAWTVGGAKSTILVGTFGVSQK